MRNIDTGCVVTIADLNDSTGVVELVNVYDDMTVYAVRTLSGTLYARVADELTEAPADVAAELVANMRILAPHHAELLPAVAAVDGRDVMLGLLPVATDQPEQVRAWMVRHGLDQLDALTASAVLAVRDVDRATAEAINRTYDLLARIGRETGQPVTRVEPAAAERAPRVRRRNRLVINGEQIA